MELFKATVTKYKACDGRIFNTRKECEKYEDEEMDTCIKEVVMMDGIKVIEPRDCNFLGFEYGMDDYNMYAIRPNLDQLHIINRLLSMAQCNVFSETFVGKNIIIYKNDCGEWNAEPSEELINRVIKTHNKYFGPVEEDGSEDK